MEKATMLLAILMFLIHLFLVFLAKHFSDSIVILSSIESNYLSSISTPFTIILIFEIFILVVSLPEFMSKSIELQYQVVSLVFLRRVFKDISELESIVDISNQLEVFQGTFIDMSGSILMFLLIILFRYVTRAMGREDTELDRLIVKIKKVASTLLIGVLISIGGYYLGLWARDLIDPSFQNGETYIREFFERFFVLMIFVDIVLVIISFMAKERYSLIFRDAGLILTVIFIRLSFTIPKYYDLALALMAIVFGIIISAVFILYKKYNSLPPLTRDKEYPIST